jgi:hypothetical protein
MQARTPGEEDRRHVGRGHRHAQVPNHGSQVADLLGAEGAGGVSDARPALRDAPPPDAPLGEVAYYPCDDGSPFSPGLYPLEALARSKGDRRPPPATAISGVSQKQAFERARFVVFDARCHGPLPAETRARFELLAARGQSMLMVRK